jgi:peptide deformylase
MACLPSATRHSRQAEAQSSCIIATDVVTEERTMAIREIRKYPDPVLRKRALPVKTVDDELRKLVDDMIETMYAEPGVGLAAPQIGVSLRLLVTDITVGEKPDSLIVLVNPKIVSSSGRVIEEEGCLSIPNIRAEIPRAESVEIRGWDLDQQEVILKERGYLARAFQHEMDHLDGILIWDRMSKIQREVLKNEWKRGQRDPVRR